MFEPDRIHGPPIEHLIEPGDSPDVGGIDVLQLRQQIHVQVALNRRDDEGLETLAP
ncbi:hypothetical protein WBG99_23800 [Streptomyces sp. TG1A-60]|uniref:hypothetical protein n=1 Tax=Streptomyces sp. TG1A-60 TaxID=3129111 RepID=UPI0030CF8502